MTSDKTKGSSKRLIEVPGYHIRPQYDLVHTRHLLHIRSHSKKKFTLMLTPLVDLFSILVIYLIMNFSSTGEVFFINKDIKIPQVTKGTPLQSFPLVSVVNQKILFDALGANKKSIFVEELNDGVNTRLRETLRLYKRIEEQIVGAAAFKGQINIQADESIDVEEVKKAMRILIEEGWTTINFVVEPNAQKRF